MGTTLSNAEVDALVSYFRNERQVHIASTYINTTPEATKEMAKIFNRCKKDKDTR